LSRPIAFAPGFAAPRHPLLWSGEGIGGATPVATPDGPVPAERLRHGGQVLGDGGRVLTLTGLRRIGLPATVFRRLGLAAPVQIAAGALGPGMPTAPLLLGPAQRIRLAGGWIAAGQLVDGLGVRHLARGVQMVLIEHAGGAVQAAGLMLAPAGRKPAPPDPGAEAAVLLRQADGAEVPAAAPEGYVDHADRFGLVGWARDPAAPARVLPLEVVAGGAVVGRMLADQPRPDLGRDARHGFALRFATPLPAGRPWLVGVRRADSRTLLPGTPLLIDAAATAPEGFDIALAGLGEDAAALRFLADLLTNTAGARRR
jgi:hypothetical protein